MGPMLCDASLTPDCSLPLTGVGVVDAPRRPQAQEADCHDNSRGHSRHPRPRAASYITLQLARTWSLKVSICYCMLLITAEMLDGAEAGTDW